MLQLWNTTKLFLNIFCLRVKPDAAPYSVPLLLALAIFFIFTKSVILMWFIHIVDRNDPLDVINITYTGATLIAVVWLLVLFATLRSILSYYDLSARFVQTALSFVAVDCILNCIYLLWLGTLVLLQVPNAAQLIVSMIVVLGFVLMMYWQFMVYIHLLIYSMEISILKAGVFTLIYMLVQHNLSEILLNSVITVIKL